jgi:hypothetical protein
MRPLTIHQGKSVKPKPLRLNPVSRIVHAFKFDGLRQDDADETLPVPKWPVAESVAKHNRAVG